MTERLRPIDHVRACHRHDPSAYRPLLSAGRQVGRLRRDHARRLLDADGVFVAGRDDGEAVALERTLDDAPAEERTAAVGRVVDRLVAAGDLPRRRGEDYAATSGWGAPVSFLVDRAHVPVFGVRAYGQHVNGLVGSADGAGGTCGTDGVSVWIGVRARDRAVAPGQLDNMVAGGLPAGLSLAVNLAKEGAEEAGLAPALMAEARPVGAIRYRLDVPTGLRDDVLFVYDLWLPAEIEPVNRDGEVERFERRGLADIADALTRPDLFKFNVPLVLIHLLIRRGAILPDDPDYLDLVGGLGGLAPTK